MPTARLDELDRRLRLNEAGNNEVLFAWLDLAVAQPLRSGGARSRAFLTTQGRAQVRQAAVTRRSAKDESWGRPIAVRVYGRREPSYHPHYARAICDKLRIWRV